MRTMVCGALLALAWLLVAAGRQLRGTGAGAHGRTFIGRAVVAGGERIDLDSYRWKRRLLLVFAPSAKMPAYQDQQRLLTGHDAQLAERDVTRGAFVRDGSGYLGASAVSGAASAEVRVWLGVSADRFAVLLVGKDGGVKLTRAEPISAVELIAVIDAMPMRRAGQR